MPLFLWQIWCRGCCSQRFLLCRRVREQLTTELRDVESALKSLKEKHSELRAHLQEKEDKLATSEALNRSLQTQLVETRKVRSLPAITFHGF